MGKVTSGLRSRIKARAGKVKAGARKVSPLKLLRPLAGRRLPRELSAPRVYDTATALRGGLRDPEFRAVMSRIESGPFVTSQRVDVFLRGDDAFAGIRADIQRATGEILLESYILQDDEGGRDLLQLLTEASARGVRVRVLADDIGSWTTRKTFWTAMRSGGIEVRLYHRVAERWWMFLHRDHRKILVVDRRVCYTGGMNIGERYSHRGLDGTPLWRDTHVRVEGPQAAGMALVFEEGWARSGGIPPRVPAELPDDLLPGPSTILLDSRPGRGQTETVAAMAAVLGAARRQVWITNPYFAPPRFAIRLLRHTVRRGVDVRLMLPGPSDMPLVRHAGHGYFARLLRGGVRIFEYQTAVLHAKTVVADDYASIIGSTNLDFRSFIYNAECNVLVLGSDVGRALSAGFEEDMRSAKEILAVDWRKRNWLHQTGDRLARALRFFL